MLAVVDDTTELTRFCTSGGWRSAPSLTRDAAATAWFFASPSNASPLAPLMALTCTYSSLSWASRSSIGAEPLSPLATRLLSSAKRWVMGSCCGASSGVSLGAWPTSEPSCCLSLSTVPSALLSFSASARSSCCRSVSRATASRSFFSGELGPDSTRSTSAAWPTLVTATKSMSPSSVSHWLRNSWKYRLRTPSARLAASWPSFSALPSTHCSSASSPAWPRLATMKAWR
ncbi:hypothetical protein D3C84_627080 [compost metagenome]